MGVFFALLTSFLGAAAAKPIAADAGAPPPATLPACVSVKTESRYVPYGYNHIVVVTNGCVKAATCSVATDVNPTAQSVDIASGKGAEVLTFSGSPSSTFTARVSCTLR